MKRVLLSLAAFLVLTFVSMSVQADVIFSQSPFSTGLGSGLVSSSVDLFSPLPSGGSSRVYDDFTLTSEATINKITWWGVAYGTPQFTITFYSNNNGPTGTGTSVSFGAVDIEGNVNGTGMSKYSATLASPLIRTAGTYWLSIYDAAGTSWGWQIAAGTGSLQEAYDTSGTLMGYYDKDGNLVFTPPTGLDGTTNVAFQLEGTQVPVPAAIWLFGPGLAGLAALRYRRRMR